MARRRGARLPVPIVVTALHVGTLDLVCDHVFFAGDVPATVLTLQFLTALPFAFLVSSHRASLLALPAIFFVDGVAAYFVYAYQIDIRADTLAFAYETDLAEASAFVDPALLGVASLGFAVGAILARLSWADAGRYRWSRLVAVLVLLPVFELAEDDLRELKVPLTLPLQIVGESRVYWREKA
jgi:glucan phosphoethanolaminetransferase (alkaline phosphatase superfamily)